MSVTKSGIFFYWGEEIQKNKRIILQRLKDEGELVKDLKVKGQRNQRITIELVKKYEMLLSNKQEMANGEKKNERKKYV